MDSDNESSVPNVNQTPAAPTPAPVAAATPAVATGIENTKAVIHMAIALVNTIHQAESDGSINIGDVGLLLNLLPAIQGGIKDIGAVPKEIGDLSVAEVAELTAFVIGDLKIANEKATLVITKALALVASAIDLLGAIKG